MTNGGGAQPPRYKSAFIGVHPRFQFVSVRVSVEGGPDLRHSWFLIVFCSVSFGLFVVMIPPSSRCEPQNTFDLTAPDMVKWVKYYVDL